MISIGLGPLEKELPGSFWGRRSFLKLTLLTAKPLYSHRTVLRYPVPFACSLRPCQGLPASAENASLPFLLWLHCCPPQQGQILPSSPPPAVLNSGVPSINLSSVTVTANFTTLGDLLFMLPALLEACLSDRESSGSQAFILKSKCPKEAENRHRVRTAPKTIARPVSDFTNGDKDDNSLTEVSQNVPGPPTHHPGVRGCSHL